METTGKKTKKSYRVYIYVTNIKMSSFLKFQIKKYRIKRTITI